MKEAFPVKLQTENLCFCKAQDAQVRNMMQSSGTFIRRSGFIPEVKKKKKKSALISGWENIIAYWKEYKQSKALVNKLGFF